MTKVNIPQIKSTAPTTNVEFISSKCKVTTLQLEVTPLAETVLGKRETFNLIPNSTRHLHLESGTYIFGIGFINATDPATVTMEVKTPQDDAMIPAGPQTATAATGTSGTYSFLVQV